MHLRLVQVLAPEADLIRPIKGVLEISPLPEGEALGERIARKPSGENAIKGVFEAQGCDG